MVTQKEFLDIIEKHTTLGSDGSVIITDPALAEKYKEFLLQHAPKAADRAVASSNTKCVNIYCPAQ